MILTLAGGVIATSASAQTGERTNHRLMEMQRVLNLTRPQMSEIRHDLMRAKAERRHIQMNAALSADEKDLRMKEVRKHARSEIKAVLTPGQLKAWREFRKAHKAK
ncbi:MAG TPA: hypothetical protein VG944_01325 [Fimbriimonas sp.]|nr:hypothetical protein [Fimbriimonas sp.]